MNINQTKTSEEVLKESKKEMTNKFIQRMIKIMHSETKSTPKKERLDSRYKKYIISASPDDYVMTQTEYLSYLESIEAQHLEDLANAVDLYDAEQERQLNAKYGEKIENDDYSDHEDFDEPEEELTAEEAALREAQDELYGERDSDASE